MLRDVSVNNLGTDLDYKTILDKEFITIFATYNFHNLF